MELSNQELLPRRYINGYKNIKNMDRFFEMVDQCKGSVELVTKQGDRLNLKSKLTQYISFAGIFGESEIKELELIVSEPEDVDLLIKYLVYG